MQEKHEKNLEATILLVNFIKAFDCIRRKGVNTTRIGSLLRNSYHNNDALWKKKKRFTHLMDIPTSSILLMEVHHHHHHHYVVPLAWISLTLSRHFSLSFIASGRSSWLHPVSSHSCCMYVRAGRPTFAWPYAGVHRSTSLMSLSLLLQQCPACLVHLIWIVFVMGGRSPYSWCLEECWRQDLFNIACNIHVYLPTSFFSSRLVSVQVVHPYSSIDTTAAWKKLRFILSVRSDFHMIDSLSIAVHAFVSRVSMSFSFDETLLYFESRLI